MKLNQDDLEKIIEELKRDPDRKEELLRDFKLFHSFFSSDDGIPPRFKGNFRDDPGWEKVSGLDFEAIGRILVCHLCIEHYIENLIELSAPPNWDWRGSRLTFSQKFKLVRNMRLFSESNFDRGVDILNSIRNKLSHDLMAGIDKDKVDELRSILLEYVTKGKSEQERTEVKAHFEQFDVHATIERFTSLSCAMIGGYCSRLVGGTIDANAFYNQF